MKPEIRSAVAAQLGEELSDIAPATGGFTANWRARAGERSLFIKVSPDADRLRAEADGLAALAACTQLLVQSVLAQGEAGDQSFLAMTWLPLETSGDPARLGSALAALHTLEGLAYGWHRDNYLGATPQANSESTDWATFFARRRLAPQLERARANGHGVVSAPGNRLLAALPELLADHRPPPALLHGDLWQGNTGYVGGRPAVFDPAVHYGDPECDLAMAAFFGGFPSAFFAAHAALHPLRPGWQRRRKLYQLYHLLNHLNLFGSGYLGDVLKALEDLT